MLELLEKAIACEKVSTITITLKPNQKPKQATAVVNPTIAILP